MNTATRETDHRSDLLRLQGKYLTFRLGPEEYGFEIKKVREIIGMIDITRLPRTPGFVKGVVNLRGKVIPVVDLRLKFSMDERPYDERTCIIVVEAHDGNEVIPMGVIVDSVTEVLNVSSEDLEPVPDFGVEVDTGFILAMAKGREIVRALVDIDKVLTTDELRELACVE